jgi:(E)-4-hydroxy-3-methylbut-2-enyl-diphosphate synthase
MAEEITEYIQKMIPQWRTSYPGVEEMDVAVMGCVVNGPGESKHANIGISLPGTFEEPKAPVYIDGEHSITLKGEGLVEEFKEILFDYVKETYGAGA